MGRDGRGGDNLKENTEVQHVAEGSPECVMAFALQVTLLTNISLGIGFQRRDNGTYVVVECSGQAQRRGMLAGDCLLTVNGVDVVDLKSEQEVVALIKNGGAVVNFEVERGAAAVAHPKNASDSSDGDGSEDDSHNNSNHSVGDRDSSSDDDVIDRSDSPKQLSRSLLPPVAARAQTGVVGQTKRCSPGSATTDSCWCIWDWCGFLCVAVTWAVLALTNYVNIFAVYVPCLRFETSSKRPRTN